VSSNINYLSIDQNYPVAGQDNDTQTLRDNFDTIKTSLRVAGEEITDIQTNGARLDDYNDFRLNVISNAVLENVREQKHDAGVLLSASPITVDFLYGPYQIYRIGADVSMDFLNFPGDPELTSEDIPVGVGTVRLELLGGSELTPVTVDFISSNGTLIKKDPSFPSVLELDSATDPVIIEVWRHSQETIYMRYLGKFQ
jgi:hypothetical protein